jgi:hypothetical protein
MTTTTNISRHCADGKHKRCLGTVALLPTDDGGKRIVPCECSSDQCTHTPPATPSA